jgi:hypothetical protein
MAKEKKETVAAATEDAAAPSAEVVSQDAATPPAPVETEQQRKFREDYQRRNEAEIAARREILKSNGLPDDTAGIDPKEAFTRCCG